MCSFTRLIQPRMTSPQTIITYIQRNINPYWLLFSHLKINWCDNLTHIINKQKDLFLA